MYVCMCLPSTELLENLPILCSVDDRNKKLSRSVCFLDSIIVLIGSRYSFQRYDRWGNVVCHGNESDIKEGHKSFPSGHTSCKVLIFIFIF